MEFDVFADRVQNYFETEDSRTSYLTEWQHISLHLVVAQNLDKPHVECLEILINRWKTLQRFLRQVTKDDYPVGRHSP